ncbi:FadR/GntR family transcriptional regulator [Maridesulfovibrio zosterae]|uniref:FadR/GntR family transcriptional regulator n=1 Tax=Maridesulfovibrio zosterae TaxID=82171 RepID=UPI0003FAF62E|nr:GntR family transcriptional regulator [Maridesulfovibrio zosterae]
MSKKQVFAKKQKTGRFEDVVSLIKREILLKTYKVGDMLPREEELATQLGISRPMVREALAVLKTEGYLEARRGVGGGTFVKDILQSSQMGELISDLIVMDQMSIADLCNARLFLEPECARAAALNATPVEIRTLAKILDKTSNAKNRVEAVEHTSDFHNYVALCSKNIYFAMSIRAMMGFTSLFIETLVDLNDDIHDDKAHEIIFDAIASRNPQEAYEQMFVHVVELKKSMCKLEAHFREVTNNNMRE